MQVNVQQQRKQRSSQVEESAFPICTTGYHAISCFGNLAAVYKDKTKKVLEILNKYSECDVIFLEVF